MILIMGITYSNYGTFVSSIFEWIIGVYSRRFRSVLLYGVAAF